MDPIVIAVLAIAVVAVIVIAKTAIVVPQQSAFVVENLGKYSRTIRAGFHILIPFVERVAYRHTLKEQATGADSREHVTSKKPGFTVTDQWDTRPERAEEHEEQEDEEKPVQPDAKVLKAQKRQKREEVASQSLDRVYAAAAAADQSVRGGTQRKKRDRTGAPKSPPKPSSDSLRELVKSVHAEDLRKRSASDSEEDDEPPTNMFS